MYLVPGKTILLAFKIALQLWQCWSLSPRLPLQEPVLCMTFFKVSLSHIHISERSLGSASAASDWMAGPGVVYIFTAYGIRRSVGAGSQYRSYFPSNYPLLRNPLISLHYLPRFPYPQVYYAPTWFTSHSLWIHWDVCPASSLLPELVRWCSYTKLGCYISLLLICRDIISDSTAMKHLINVAHVRTRVQDGPVAKIGPKSQSAPYIVIIFCNPQIKFVIYHQWLPSALTHCISHYKQADIALNPREMKDPGW